MRIRKNGGRKKKMVWRWRGKEVEEVREIKYSGFVFKKNEAQVRRIKKGAAVMGQMWK